MSATLQGMPSWAPAPPAPTPPGPSEYPDPLGVADKAPVQELTDAAYSAPIQIKIAASPVLLTAPANVTLAPGAKLEVPLKFERRYGFADAVTLDFAAPTGIKGLTAAKLTVPKEAAEAKLIIAAAADAPAGIHACKLNANCTFNGEAIPWSIEFNVEVKP